MYYRYQPRVSMAFPLMLAHQGKTREIYYTSPGSSELLVVASNRISTHNVVHKSIVEGKGEVLTALTVFWLVDVLGKAGIPHHLVAYGQKIYDHLPGGRGVYPSDLHRYAIVVRRAEVIPVEFIFREYLEGSLWAGYAKGEENPYGLHLPHRGLPRMMRFSRVNGFLEPAFTPTQKSENDEPMRGDEVATRYPHEVEIAKQVFDLGQRHLNQCGIALIDTKFELGRVGINGNTTQKSLLVDEVLTPDSSRFCKLSDVKEGEAPRWLDKQVARDEAERVWAGGTKVPLSFSNETRRALTWTYAEVFKTIVGMSLERFFWERLDDH